MSKSVEFAILITTKHQFGHLTNYMKKKIKDYCERSICCESSLLLSRINSII